MKNRIKILLGAVIGSSLLLSSCNFLDVDNYFQATFKEDSIFHSMKNAEGYLWNTPTRFPDAGAIWGNSWNPGETASDEIAVRWQTNEFWGAQFSVGTVNGRNLRQDIWYSMYVVVARCNRMLENIDKVSDMTEADRRRYIGYVHFMRGYAYYHLLMNYGPLLIVGDEVLPNLRNTMTGNGLHTMNRWIIFAMNSSLPHKVFMDRPSRVSAIPTVLPRGQL